MTLIAQPQSFPDNALLEFRRDTPTNYSAAALRPLRSLDSTLWPRHSIDGFSPFSTLYQQLPCELPPDPFTMPFAAADHSTRRSTLPPGAVALYEISSSTFLPLAVEYRREERRGGGCYLRIIPQLTLRPGSDYLLLLHNIRNRSGELIELPRNRGSLEEEEKWLQRLRATIPRPHNLQAAIYFSARSRRSIATPELLIRQRLQFEPLLARIESMRPRSHSEERLLELELSVAQLCTLQKGGRSSSCPALLFGAGLESKRVTLPLKLYLPASAQRYGRQRSSGLVSLLGDNPVDSSDLFELPLFTELAEESGRILIALDASRLRRNSPMSYFSASTEEVTIWRLQREKIHAALRRELPQLLRREFGVTLTDRLSLFCHEAERCLAGATADRFLDEVVVTQQLPDPYRRNELQSVGNSYGDLIASEWRKIELDPLRLATDYSRPEVIRIEGSLLFRQSREPLVQRWRGE